MDQEFLRDHIPQPTSWFSPIIEYEGQGIAVFDNPRGILEGDALTRYDDKGGVEITMRVRNFALEDDKGNLNDLDFSSSDLAVFLNGKDPRGGKSHFARIGSSINVQCLSLEITTPEGRFTAHDPILAPYVMLVLEEKTVQITCKMGEFVTARLSDENTHFHVLPLLNFQLPIINIYGFTYCTSHRRHPLQLFIAPEFPNSLSDEQLLWAQFASRRPIIPFELQNTEAFIEPLPDYDVRQNILKSGGEESLLTAIVVGEHDGTTVSLNNWSEYLPIRLLPILSLATGSRVTAPWIEFRDPDGKLLRRLHINLAHPTYRQGHAVLGQGVQQESLSLLLSKAQQSSHLNMRLFSVISQIMQANRLSYYENIEDAMSHIFRAIDTLCEYAGFRDQNDLYDLLDDADRRIAKKIYSTASSRLEKLAKKIENQDIAYHMRVAANRIHDTRISRPGFGIALSRLMENLGFPDSKILNTYYQGRDNNWLETLQHYRNKIMHESWFQWDKKHPEIMELAAMTFHLHDIVVRIVLKLLEYDGEYIPSIIKKRGISYPVDWVMNQTPPQELGYPEQDDENGEQMQ